MEVDQELLEQGTPPGTPFNEGFTPSKAKSLTPKDPTRGVYTNNYFTPLYNESQASDHSNVNTNQQHPPPMRTRNEPIRDAELAAIAAAAAANQQPPTREDIQNVDTAAVVARAANLAETIEAEAVATNEARLEARLVEETKAAAAVETAAPLAIA